MTEEQTIEVELESHGRSRRPVIDWIGGPKPYLWVGSGGEFYAALEIPPRLARRTRNLLRDLAEQDR